MKYMGSKARFADDILSIILRDRKPNQWYAEPFGGGMNTICKVSGNRIANDINFYLIEMWKEIINGWIPNFVTRDEYENIRLYQDKYPAHIVGWVGFNCSYSGKWWGGFAGETNTNIGTVRNYQREAIKNIVKQAREMQDVVLNNTSYLELYIPTQAIVYCDPPYAGTTGYSNEFNHDEFWNWCRLKNQEGHKIWVSEYNAPEDFTCAWIKTTNSSLSANGKTGSNKKSIEKLFTLGEIPKSSQLTFF